MALRPKQILFVKEYLIDKNASRAAKAAGYSKKTAAQIGLENLVKPEIRAAIAAGLDQHAKRADVTAERIINRLAELAFDKKYIKESDIIKSCELLGKHLGLFRDIQEITGKDGGPQVILTMPSNGREAKK